MLSFVLTFFLAGTNLLLPPKDFWSFWGDGKAEISSYRIKVSRYNELRDGYAVLIYVTEDMNRKTRIKVESDRVPQKDRLPVLKLNHIMKFTTGIYDYSVMTSVFSSVESEFGRPPLKPMKISLTSQEWCGHVFMMAIPNSKKLELTVHSYFEREGDQQRELDIPRDAMYEDNLWIWIRELKGEVLPVGEKRQVSMLPSMWHARSKHVSVAFQPAWIAKEKGETIEFEGATRATWKWSWNVAGKTMTVWVEQDYPHRIIRWESSLGESGELIKSVRLPYWMLNQSDKLFYRKELGIPE